MSTQAVPPSALEARFEQHRRGLTGDCYRMLGSGAEAEDAVQETMVRAWQAADGLKAQAALKSWLYRIPAVGIYNVAEGGYEPWAIVVVECSGGRIAALHHFLYPDTFSAFGLPPRLDAQGVGVSAGVAVGVDA